MTYPLPVSPGEPVQAIEYNKLVDAVKDFASGGGGFPRLGSQVLVNVENTTGRAVTIGEALQISEVSGVDGADVYSALGEAVYKCVDPVWHTAIDRVVVAAEDIPDTEHGIAVAWGHCVVKANLTNDVSSFLMIDSTAPTQFQPATSGIAKSFLSIDVNYMIAMLGSAQRLWQYQLLENSQAPLTTQAWLLDIDGGQYANPIALSDPLGLMDDQVTGQKGFCLHVGNRFFAIQAPC